MFGWRRSEGNRLWGEWSVRGEVKEERKTVTDEISP